MRRVERPTDLWDCEKLEQGDFYFHVEDDGQRFFTVMLPANHVCRIPIRPILPGRETVNGGHSWEWDGNEAAPTLMPSVHSIGTWHGWVRAGRLESC